MIKNYYDKKGSFKFFIKYINETDTLTSAIMHKTSSNELMFKYFDSNNKCINHDKEQLKNATKYKIRLTIY